MKKEVKGEREGGEGGGREWSTADELASFSQ